MREFNNIRFAENFLEVDGNRCSTGPAEHANSRIFLTRHYTQKYQEIAVRCVLEGYWPETLLYESRHARKRKHLDSLTFESMFTRFSSDWHETCRSS